MSSEVKTEPTIKERVAHVVQQLPDDCTFDDVFYHLETLEMLYERIKKADDPSTVWISQDEVEKQMQKWLIK